jgi:nitrite reductase (NAD(P)H)
MGINVASFGDYLANKQISMKSRSGKLVVDSNVLHWKSIEPAQPAVKNAIQRVPPVSESTSTRPAILSKRMRSADEPVKCLVYNDPFGSTYKKYIFTADGKYLLGGMMIGDNSDFVKLVAIVKKKVFPSCCSLYSITRFMLSYF